ncbi:MAG: single-stranded DNA-binding protein [Acidobacteria bacterium]|nr:single-stranded DNA-binding protein [Acidobacteriota bacterium]
MSGSMNKVLLIGNLGKDPELKMTPGGQPMARFSVATTETWKDKDGGKQSKTEWHNIVVWGKQAEIAEKFLRKGKQVLIEGRIQYREYQDQAGVKKYATDIRCDNFQMLGRMDEGGGGGARESYGSRGGGSSFDDEGMTPPPAAAGGFPDDDIPF